MNNNKTMNRKAGDPVGRSGDPDGCSGKFYWEGLIWRAARLARLTESGDRNLTVRRFCTDMK